VGIDVEPLTKAIYVLHLILSIHWRKEYCYIVI